MGNEELTTILVVEDNKDMLSFLQRQFAGLYHVLVAGNGVEALSVLSDARVSLVITDIMMPEMDGLELCEHLKLIWITVIFPLCCSRQKLLWNRK